MGELSEETSDEIVVLETNVDDASGEILGYTMDRLISCRCKRCFLFSDFYEEEQTGVYKLTVPAPRIIEKRLRTLFLRKQQRLAFAEDTKPGACLGEKL